MSNAFESESKKSFQELLEALQRDRERLRVQMNLAAKELRDEWDQLEETWEKFEQSVSEVTHETGQVVHEVAEELKDAYRVLEQKVKDMG